MKPRRHPRAIIYCLILFCGASVTFCQNLLPPVPPSLKPCLRPAPLPGVREYDGPLEKTVGLFAGALERNAVHQYHYKPGTVLCSLELKDKFLLFVNDSIDPVNFLGAGFNAGIDQSSNRDPTFGLGAKGYAKRFGANLADSESDKFFKSFLFPVIFSEDPRYYRLGQGTHGRRVLHAVGHVFIGHHEDGTPMFNYSGWLGSISSAALSNVYHPGNQHGVWDTAQRIGYGFAFDVGFDLLREYWPEISRKFKLPFGGAPLPVTPTARPSQP